MTRLIVSVFNIGRLTTSFRYSNKSPRTSLVAETQKYGRSSMWMYLAVETDEPFCLDVAFPFVGWEGGAVDSGLSPMTRSGESRTAESTNTSAACWTVDGTSV